MWRKWKTCLNRSAIRSKKRFSGIDCNGKKEGTGKEGGEREEAERVGC